MVRTDPAADALARRAEIARQLAKICPRPLSPAELERAADIVDHMAANREIVWLVGRLDLADREARVCRGDKVNG